MSDYYDEATEKYQTPDTVSDKDETMPSLFQEDTSPKPVRKISKVSKPKMRLSIQTARERYDYYLFKNDSIRKKYDTRKREIEK